MAVLSGVGWRGISSDKAGCKPNYGGKRRLFDEENPMKGSSGMKHVEMRLI
jgi:hypothetical protein